MPDKRKKQLFELIRSNGGRLVRQKKHLVYRFPNGETLTVSKSPSSSRAWHKSLGDLKRLLRTVAV